MVSGIEWYEQWEDTSDATVAFYAQPDIAAFVASKPQAHAPGAHFQYSSGNYQLVQHALRCAPALPSPRPRQAAQEPLQAAHQCASSSPGQPGAGPLPPLREPLGTFRCGLLRSVLHRQDNPMIERGLPARCEGGARGAGGR